jgi:hypothetical protein
MENLGKAEKALIRDLKAFFIRNKLELVTWQEDELGYIFVTNNEETGGEENIFLRLEELAKEIGVTII